MTKPRDVRRALNTADQFLTTKPGDPQRTHFRCAVAFAVENGVTTKDEIAKTGGLTTHQVDNALKGQRTAASEDARKAFFGLLAQKGTNAGVDIPASVAKAAGLNVAM